MVGASVEEVEALLGELASVGVHSVTVEGAIFSRRMVNDEKLRETRAAGGIQSLRHPNVARPKVPRKGTAMDGTKLSLPPSPSSSSPSSSTSSIPVPPDSKKSVEFNSIEVSQALCSENGWSGERMIWALQAAIEFQSNKEPELEPEQLGEWLVKAYAEHRATKGSYAVGPQKFFEQGLYASACIGRQARESVVRDNPATRALVQLERD
jgi:hypothetical protein